MACVLKRPLAEEDLDGIWDYIAEDKPDAATKFLCSLKEKLKILSENPRMGVRRDELMSGIRSFPVGRYVIFYAVINDGIDVLRVLPAAMDIQNFF